MKPPAALAAGFRRLVAPAGPTTPRGAALGPQLLTVVAAALIAGQLAILVWHFVPGATRRSPPPVTQAAPHAAADVADILRAHLFGAQDVAAQSGENAPRSRAALILSGTLAVRDPKEGLAIVGETAQNGRLYAVGAVLPGGVKLHEVYTDRVVLERDGALETLALPRQFAAGNGPAQASLSPAGNSGEPPLADSVQRLIAQGPEVIGEVLRPMPTYVDGHLKGFRVYAGRDRAKFAALGLHAGDLVTQINGVPLSDAQRGMEILRSLGSAGTAAVTVERGATTQQLTVDASQIAGLSQPGAAPGPPPSPTDPPQPNSD
jgi:general secretion pathway protein C